MAVFSERVTAITYNDIMPTIVDAVNNSNILTARVMSNVKNWKGVNMKQPIRIANSTTGGSFDGLDQFDTSTTNNTRSLTWYVKAYEQSVVIPGIEKAVNGNSDKQVISLVTDRLDEAKISLTQAIGTLLYGMGNGKDIEGLGLIVDDGGDLLYGMGNGKDIEGLGLIVDDGTATSNYGGLARTVAGNAADVTAATGGAITLDLVGAEFSAVSAAGAANEAPTMGLTTQAVWDLFEKILGTKIHANYETTSIAGYNKVSGKTPMGTSIPAAELKGAAGFNAISFRGRPVVADDKCTSGVFFWLNERYLEFRRLISKDLKQVSSVPEKTEGPDEDIKQPSFLQLKDFMAPINQFGEIGALIVMGNYICRAPRRQGKITGITTASY